MPSNMYETLRSGSRGRTIGNFDKSMYSCSLRTRRDEDELTCSGFRKNKFKLIIYRIASALTVGLLSLVCYWFPNLYLFLTHDVSYLDSSDTVLVLRKTSQSTEKAICQLEEAVVSAEEGMELMPVLIAPDDRLFKHHPVRFFYYMHQRFFWIHEEQTFSECLGYDRLLNPNQIRLITTGLPSWVRLYRLQLFGRNLIDIPIKTFLRLVLELFADPFYMFQLFSIILWSTEHYYYYATVIMIMSLVTILITAFESRQHMHKLRSMVTRSERVTVLTDDGAELSCESEFLVPGDVLVVPQTGCNMHCDAALLSGECIVMEGMLTGESFPVSKTALSPNSTSDQDPPFSCAKYKQHVLFCGTQVLNARARGCDRVLAVVLSTGYSTQKGALMSEVVCPRQIKFALFRDIMIFLCFLASIGVLGFGYCLYINIINAFPIRRVFVRALDTITIIIPPALSTVMSVCIAFFLSRIKRQNILCTDPPRINVCGKLNLICFDKTGTLTEEHLGVKAALTCFQRTWEEPIHPSKLYPSPLLYAMVSCHNLVRMNGSVVGDPLEDAMFACTQWTMLDSKSSKEDCISTFRPPNVRKYSENDSSISMIEISLLRRFPFDSVLQRMSVLTKRRSDDCMRLYTKGSPEIIQTLCLPETIPENILHVVSEYAQQGDRVLAVAYRLCSHLQEKDIDQEPRHLLESNLAFCGLIIFSNILKPESNQVVHELMSANIRVCMITGDNLHTAVNVAGRCGIIPSQQRVIKVSVNSTGLSHSEVSYSLMKDPEMLSSTYQYVSNVEFSNSKSTGTDCMVVDGSSVSTIREHHTSIYRRLLVRGAVFSRMSPMQKAMLVEDLQTLGYCVGMCGDGANDCAALKAANVGIALSSEEASLASPFTCTTLEITCVPTLIKEGRAALVTSLSSVKFICMYSFIQYSSILILFWVGSQLSDVGSVVIDLVYVLPLVTIMSEGSACNKLSKRRPLSRLFHPQVLCLIIWILAIQLAAQTAAYFTVLTVLFGKNTVNEYKIYVKTSEVPADIENAAIFSVSSFLYIGISLIMTQGYPHREPMYYNSRHMVLVVAMLFSVVCILFFPGKLIRDELLMSDIPTVKLRLALVGIAAVSILLALVMERVVMHTTWIKQAWRRICKKRRRNQYKTVLAEIDADASWPLLGS